MANDDVTCPYCEAEMEICNDDGFGMQEDTRHEQECYECGKIFVFETYIYWDYEASKADCLNGSPHRLRISVRECPDETYYHRHESCMDCDYSKHTYPEKE